MEMMVIPVSRNVTVYVFHRTPEITFEKLFNPAAAARGEYIPNLRASVGLLRLAEERQVLDEEQLRSYVCAFRSAMHALDLHRAQDPLLKLLYERGIDYSEILLSSGVIDWPNAWALSESIARVRANRA